MGGLSLVRRGTTGGQEEMCERDAMQDAGECVCVREEWVGGGHESDCECLKETQKVLRLLVGSCGEDSRGSARKNVLSHSWNAHLIVAG